MEENSKQIEEQTAVPTLGSDIGSGAMLAKARKELGKSVEEIADELNLSVTQIRTIELDQSEGLPEPTYVRGYIRSYARLVGLNPEEVLLHYQNRNWQKSANLDEIPRGITEGDISSGGGFFSAGKVITLLMAVAIAGFFFWPDDVGDFFSDENSVATTVTSENSNDEFAQTSDDSTMVEVDDNESVPEAVSTSDSVGNIATDEEESATSTATAADEPVVPVAPDNRQTRVRLTFTETSWVDIRDQAQNRLAYQSYPEGEVLEVGAEGVLSVLIGNAKGVQMQVNGEPYDLSQHTKGVYAKFSVGTPVE